MISCIANGELRYIRKAQDFEDCMEFPVYQALKEFFGLDGDEGNYIEKINELESDVCNMSFEISNLEDEISDLENKNDDLGKLVEKYEDMQEKVTKRIEELKASSNYPHNFMGQMVEDFEWVLKQLD